MSHTVGGTVWHTVSPTVPTVQSAALWLAARFVERLNTLVAALSAVVAKDAMRLSLQGAIR